VREVPWHELLDLVNLDVRRTGTYNTGDHNSDNYNTGGCNTDDHNSGNRNSGDC